MWLCLSTQRIWGQAVCWFHSQICGQLLYLVPLHPFRPIDFVSQAQRSIYLFAGGIQWLSGFDGCVAVEQAAALSALHGKLAVQCPEPQTATLWKS